MIQARFPAVPPMPTMTWAIANGEKPLIQMKMPEGGRVVVAMEIHKKMGLNDGEARLTTRLARLRRIQAMARQYVPEGVFLVDELIAERRAEVEGE